MKTTRQFLAFGFTMMLVASSYATVRTVSNSPTTTIAQFSTIQAAVNASVAGDTVYVHGSPVTYSGFTITNKQLVIIGPGWAPDKTFAFGANISGNITITGIACSNTEIQGLACFAGQLNCSISHPNNLRFIRNQFYSNYSTVMNETGNGAYSGYTFEGNVFGAQASVSSDNSTIHLNLVFRNNYFCSNNAKIGSLGNSTSTILFDHNLWYSGGDCFGGCQFLTITNNIFVQNPAGGASNSTFNNNITFNTANNTPWLSNGNSNGGGNIANQDPQMTAQAAVNAGTFNPLLDFTIAAGPANNAGSDGKDIGLLYDATGSLNWTNSRNSRLPRVFDFTISNPTIQPNGSLNIQVEGRKSN